jgi:DUF971 family protein
MKPVKIQRATLPEISITWDDGHQGKHTCRILRKYCPCAACKTEIEAKEGNVLLPILMPGQFELRAIEPVGSYALQFIWADGHRTGIYTYDHLRQICECEDCICKTGE